MKIKRRSVIAASLALGALPSAAIAQGSWPERQVRLIVPFAPGGGNDQIGRLLARHLTERLRQQVVVENRSGAAGIVGLQTLLAAPADGYTFSMLPQGPLDVNPAIYERLSYDPVRDFMPVAMLVRFPLFLVAHPSTGVRNVADLVALAKRRPGELTYSSGGVGNGNHLAGALLAMMSGTSLVHVPYRGSGPATLAAVAGEVSFTFASGGPALLEHVRDNRLVMLGVADRQRLAVLPDIPTVAEGGVPDFESWSWAGIIARAGTPPGPIARMAQESLAFINMPETVAGLQRDGFAAAPAGPAEFAAHIRREAERWAVVARQANIRAE
jgi:tripartite-type tricarboxylate transporter receptor subunit TctC